MIKERYKTQKATQTEAEKTLFSAIDDFLTRHGEYKIEAVGIGTVGHIDPDSGVWLQSYNIPISSPVPVCDIIKKKHGLNTYLDNDVHCATLAESQFGNGRGVRCMLYINLGTGLAVGISDNGRLLRGADNYSGEAGYMQFNADNENGNFELICSGGGIEKEAQSKADSFGFMNNITAREIFYIAAKNKAAKKIADRAIRYLGYGLCNLAALVNPDTIVFGGGLSCCEEYINKSVEFFRAHCVKETLSSIKYIGVSALGGDSAGLLGAAALAKNKSEE